MTSEWKETTLEDCTSLLGDGLHGTPQYTQNGEYAFVNGNNLVNGRIIIKSDTKRVNRTQFEKYKKELCDRTIMVSINGTLGNVALYNGEKIILGKSACYFNVLESVDKDFIRYVVSSPSFRTYLETNATGTTIKNISLKQMRDYSFYIPGYETQKRISGILRFIDDRISLNTAINENLESQAQEIFKSWFVDFEPFGGVKPEEWTEKSVYDLAEYINGAAFKKNEYSTKGIPIIKIAELKNGITDSTQYCCIEKDEKYYFDNKAILFSWSGNPETSIDTFLWYRGKAILNQHTFRVVSKYNAPAFTYFLLKYLKPKFTHIASDKQTTGLGHVTVSDLKRLQFSCSTDAIEEFEKMSKPLFDMIYNTYVESNRLSKLRDVLLPKLMNGEIDVSEVKI